jgi:endonuclease/exonuclease/phosphatase (EEP) superfamily protein YafD
LFIKNNFNREHQVPLLRIVAVAASVLAIALLIITTAAALLPAPWPFALAEHARPQLVIGGGGFALLMLACRKWRTAVAALACVALSYLAMAAVPYVEPNAAQASSADVRVVWSNVARNASMLNASLAYARNKEADIFLIGEYPENKPLTDDYAPDYPFRADTGTHPVDAYRRTRVVALSRRPIENASIIEPGDYSGRRFLTFDVHSAGNERLFQIASAHVLLPMRSASHAAQPQFLQAMAGALDEPFVIAGDLNATPWSRAYRLLPGKRVGNPKWETTYRRIGSWNPLLFALTIDHFLISPQIVVTEYEVGPDTGSNHRPLFTAFRLQDFPASESAN